MSKVRLDLDAPGGLAFFEWAFAGYAPDRIERAVFRCLNRPGISSGDSGDWPFGRWAENDWPTVLESLRTGGLHIFNLNTRETIRKAVREWLAYRAQHDAVPDGFEDLT